MFRIHSLQYEILQQYYLEDINKRLSHKILLQYCSNIPMSVIIKCCNIAAIFRKILRSSFYIRLLDGFSFYEKRIPLPGRVFIYCIVILQQ